MIPEVRIKYGWLLARVTADALHEKYSNGEPLGTDDELIAIATKYETWWRPHNDAVLNGLCEILGLEFRQNIIDIYVSPWFSPISDPMVIHPGFESRAELLNAIAHELTHRLLTDNTSIKHDDGLMATWRQMFGDHYDAKTLAHIPVHAMLKELYLDHIDRPDLLALDIEKTKANAPYAEAWAYVQKHGYESVIHELGQQFAPE